MTDENRQQGKKMPKKITAARLKNIALYYLKRFETSRANLRSVLRRRVDGYAFVDKEFNRAEAYEWVENLLDEFERCKYVDDVRFAEIRVRGYLSAGKSPRYIAGKLKEKGIDEATTARLLAEQEFDPYDSALRLAKKKKIGPFCEDEAKHRERRAKDLAVLVRAGFDYDIAIKVLETEVDRDDVLC